MFTAQWGGPRVVVYLPGDQGKFAPYVAGETLFTDLPMGATAEQYRYGGAVDEENGLPLGNEGWQFMGWIRVALDADGNMIGDKYLITVNEYINDPIGSLGFIDNDEQTVTFTASLVQALHPDLRPHGRRHLEGRLRLRLSRARATTCP